MSDVVAEWMEVIAKINVRQVVFMLFVVITSGGFVVQQLTKKKRRNQSEDLSRFEKNQEGLYPWEVDTDDSPNRIAKDAKRYSNRQQPRRGSWR